MSLYFGLFSYGLVVYFSQTSFFIFPRLSTLRFLLNLHGLGVALKKSYSTLNEQSIKKSVTNYLEIGIELSMLCYSTVIISQFHSQIYQVKQLVVQEIQWLTSLAILLNFYYCYQLHKIIYLVVICLSFHLTHLKISFHSCFFTVSRRILFNSEVMYNHKCYLFSPNSMKKNINFSVT